MPDPLTRRALLGTLAGGALVTTLPNNVLAADGLPGRGAGAILGAGSGPTFAATWGFGDAACREAGIRLAGGGSLRDAVEAGIVAVERNPEWTSVGVGGLPNRDGVVQLDAMMMDGRNLSVGCVSALEDVGAALSVARRVMEQTPHVMLSGAGARAFAIAQGFSEEELLTSASREQWEAWKRSQEQATPPPHVDTHDTVGLIGQAADGNLVCGMSTSGWAWKMPGRVGDSPIVGAGSYADDEAGACVATGLGEEIIAVCATYAVVEGMRRGQPPEVAASEVVARLVRRREASRSTQVALLAVRADGATGAAAIQGGFQAAVARDGVLALYDIPGHAG